MVYSFTSRPNRFHDIWRSIEIDFLFLGKRNTILECSFEAILQSHLDPLSRGISRSRANHPDLRTAQCAFLIELPVWFTEHVDIFTRLRRNTGRLYSQGCCLWGRQANFRQRPRLLQFSFQRWAHFVHCGIPVPFVSHDTHAWKKQATTWLFLVWKSRCIDHLVRTGFQTYPVESCHRLVCTTSL